MKTLPTRHLFFRALVFLLLPVVLNSCLDDEPRFEKEAAYAVEETQVDAYYADADDMAGVAISQSDETDGTRVSAGARTLETNDERMCSVSVILDLGSTLLNPKGNITISFGDNCPPDSQGNVRKGKINVHFEGRRFLEGSSLSISFENYEINGVKLNGVRTLTYLETSTIAAPQFTVELTNGSVVWGNQSATREHCFKATWNRGILLAPGDDQLVIEQCNEATAAAQGINRYGVGYTMRIESPLVYKRGCPLAVSGVKRFAESGTGKEIIIDYGSGTCDSNIAIMVDGSIHTINSRR